MGRLSFDTVNALIYDPVSANRTATRAALYSLGFRLIETVATLEDFVDAIKKRTPDIALCETQGADEPLCQSIQQLRQGAAGYNPFVVIIVTAWAKNTSLINRVISSGADDLLLRPFSTGLLGSRIEAHIERRKGFVITTDYVGPDRRKDEGRGGGAPLFEPPNSLKMKAKDKMSPEAIAKRLDSELRTARETLSREKLRRDAFQACVLWRLMQDEPPAKAGDGSSPELDKLTGLAQAIDQRCRDNNEDAAAREWCGNLLAAVEGLNLGVDRNASMHLLGHAALSLYQVLHPDQAPAGHMAEIDATVAIIRARNQVAVAV